MDGSLVEGIQTSGDVETELNPRELPGSVVVRTLHLHCRGLSSNPGPVTETSPCGTSPVALPKKKFFFKELNPHLLNIQSGDFPGGPVVKNPLCNAGNVGSIPNWRTKILCAKTKTQHSQINK